MPDDPQPQAETTAGLDVGEVEQPTPAPAAETFDELDELEDTIPGRPLPQLLALHAAARAAAEPMEDVVSAPPSDALPADTTAGAPGDAVPAREAAAYAPTLRPALHEPLSSMAGDEATAPEPVSHVTFDLPAPDTGETEAAAPDEPGITDMPSPSCAAEPRTDPAPEPDPGAYAAARIQPPPSIPEVAAPTEPMPPIVRDAAGRGEADGEVRRAERGPQPSWEPGGAPSELSRDTQTTPRLGMPPIDALASDSHGSGLGSGNGHTTSLPRPVHGRPVPTAVRPRMVDVSGIHSRVPPEYWLDDDPIEETRLSLGLRGAPAVKVEAGRPLPQPRRFRRMPRWLTVVVLLFVAAIVAACVSSAIAVANVYFVHPHTTAPVPASTAPARPSPTLPKR